MILYNIVQKTSFIAVTNLKSCLAPYLVLVNLAMFL